MYGNLGTAGSQKSSSAGSPVSFSSFFIYFYPVKSPKIRWLFYVNDDTLINGISCVYWFLVMPKLGFQLIS